MHSTGFFAFASLVILCGVAALPAQISEAHVLRRQSASPLDQAAVASYKPYTYYASAAYCSPQRTAAWSCGEACSSTAANFQWIASGGDGGVVQWWYVGHDSALKTVVVGYQGTDFNKVAPILADADFRLDSFTTKLFPGIKSSVKAHNGFQEAHRRSSAAVLAAVKTAILNHNATRVTLVGHSMGGALATIGLLHLSYNLPSQISLRAVTYGMPRVGNAAFVSEVNTRGDLTRINNKRDVVPILPGRFMGFSHTEGEIHIGSDDVWTSCPGTDNTGGLCTIAAVPNLFSGDFDAHMGPYDGFTLGCDQDYLRKSGIATSSSDIPVDVSLTSLLLSEPQSI